MIRRILTALIMLVVGATTLVADETEARAVAACANVPVVAHRGGSEWYTENSRNAFRVSQNAGAGAWETDVRFTSDDVPVLMHDATVDRTTNGTGAVTDLTYAEIAQLRTDDDQPVTTLRDFINDQHVDAAYAFVELKTMPSEAQWATFAAALTSRAGLGAPKPAVSSFDPAVLDQVAVRLPGYTRALIQSVGAANPADITPHASILLKHHDAITWGRLAAWTGAGLKVYAWADPAADPQGEWVRMAGYGGSVSGYITSSPSAYLAWQRGRIC